MRYCTLKQFSVLSVIWGRTLPRILGEASPASYAREVLVLAAYTQIFLIEGRRGKEFLPTD